jgi:AmmeMemoRadiSam system protein B
MPEAYPRLRGEIDAAPAERDGETYYILYDRAGVSGSRLLASPLGLLIAGRLDGTASVLDIADALGREYGGGFACDEIERVVRALDEALFLDDARFQDFQAQAARDFRDAPVRRAESAGSAYDDDPAALAAALDRILDEAPPPEEPGSASAGDAFPRGIVVPHIDYPRGAAGYGQAYRLLGNAEAPRTVVVLGTAHTPLQERYSLCDKDFETPLGRVRTNRALCADIRRALGSRAGRDRDLLAHRGEHSIELQAVWLRHVYGDAVDIVPVLAGSLGEFIDGGLRPDEAGRDPAVSMMAACLAEAVAKGGVMLMASADLAHVGPRFGDGREITDRFLAEVEELDRDYLEALSVDAVSGLESLASHRDSMHVCGSACIHAVGLALPGARTRLLGYHQAVTPEMRQAVTFAAMAFE